MYKIRRSTQLVRAEQLVLNDKIILEDFPFTIKEIQPCSDPSEPDKTILVKAVDRGLGFPIYECLRPDDTYVRWFNVEDPD